MPGFLKYEIQAFKIKEIRALPLLIFYRTTIPKPLT